MKVLLLVLALALLASASKTPTKQEFQNCFGLNCPFNLAFWNQTAQAAHQKFQGCVTDVHNQKCVNGYAAYNAAALTDTLPQDFIDCHAQCNPKSTSDFYQNLVYGCMVTCETGVAPSLSNMKKISDMKACQANCSACDPKDILCNTLQAQQFACQQKSAQCYFGMQKFQALKANDTVPFYYYSCYESCPPLYKNTTKLFASFSTIYSCNTKCMLDLKPNHAAALKFGLVCLLLLVCMVFL